MHKLSIVTLVGVIALVVTSGALRSQQAAPHAPPQTADENTYQIFEQEDLLAQREESEQAYLPFLNVDSLRCGIYVLKAGAFDGQSPHDDEEVYYIIKGKGVLRVDGDDKLVKAGSIIYVRDGVNHQFHSIDEDLSILVFFAKGPRK